MMRKARANHNTIKNAIPFSKKNEVKGGLAQWRLRWTTQKINWRFCKEEE
jgi:hypothetical protein